MQSKGKCVTKIAKNRDASRLSSGQRYRIKFEFSTLLRKMTTGPYQIYYGR